ncbi:TlpA disulfide reductase family protein [Pareuzebyella sediminis]|uniref:TlpA disulfide reductase family protein n=1 Tax=Pareuzebyella sediminis TaxID=2607998 RepID=UPI0011EEC9EE|nr:TlpA disulfide reductase family protein [Pareuzebyella sediminis]
MKFFSKHKILIISAFILLGILGLSPIGSTVRRYTGILLARLSVSAKEDLKLSGEAYTWQLADAQTKPFGFESVKGQVVFLNFWATWCKPCIKEMPEIQKLYDDYGSKVTFLLVTQEDTKKVRSFLERRELELPIYYSQAEIPDEIASKTLPTTYIIDKEGTIKIAESGPRAWNSSQYRRLLDELIK